VSDTLECPSILETIFGCAPFVRRSVVAQVCLRSWKRMSGSSALLSSSFQCLWCRLSPSVGLPLALGNTRPRSVQEPFKTARLASCFLRYRRRVSVALFRYRDYAPYARMRS